MKKICTFALLGMVVALQANAQDFTTSPSSSVFVEYSAQQGKFDDDIDADLKGIGVGLLFSQRIGGFWGKLEYQTNDEYDADYYEFSSGGQFNFLRTERYYILGTLGLGVGLLDAESFEKTAYFTIPVGIEAGVNLNKNFSLYGGAGYKWNIEISSSDSEGGGARCRDGSYSSSTGRGTCSHHGGVSHYYGGGSYDNYVGSFNGVTYKAGLRYRF